jgi:hypothetical protein
MDDPSATTTMLTLAAIAYRGINLVYPEPFKNRRLRELMDDCMSRFSAVKDKWRIVWGPASFSASSPGLDDSLIYAAEGMGPTPSLAIAIRGTNPMSVTDWLLGDLMVTHQVPWVYGNSADRVMISTSTAIGLGILQHLLWSDTNVESNTLTVTDPSARAPSTATPLEWLDSIRSRLTAQPAISLLTRLEQNLRNTDAPLLNPGRLKGGAAPASQPGSTLKQFLSRYGANAGKYDIYVTGHSKGGALSSTLALWLADTQGPQNDPAEQWDPQKHASLHCYSFAGPTAGNAEFAAHSDVALQDCHRIWNPNDVVPHAFIPDQLTGLSQRYGLQGLEKTVCDELTAQVANAVQALDYRQICKSGSPIDCTLVAGLPLLAQIVHQHLDSYLEYFGLSDEMTSLSLLAPAI